MWINLCLAVTSAVAARVLWAGPGIIGGLAVGFAVLSVWEFYSAVNRRLRPSPAVLRLGGFTWTMEDFCRGWLITGETGSGKTLGAVNAMLWEVSKNCPTWGGVCVDDKGLYAETLSAMFTELGRKNDLLVLQVKPDGAPVDWQPTYTINFLEDPYLPYSGKAKIVCDVADALGQRSQQSFFRVQAQVQMEFAFRVLAATNFPVTLEKAYDLLTSDSLLKEFIARLEKNPSPEAEELRDHYESNFKAQPAEQLGGVKTTVANYLKYFTDPDIAAVFCPTKSTVSLSEIDRSKVICVSVPQRFTVERRYIHTLLKLVYYSHALRRFDRPAETRVRDNLLIFWAGEAQKVVTASADGLSDYNVVDMIREARATFIGDTQAYTSLIPPMEDEKKAKVFIANMANRITFKAADEDSARIAADTIGKRKMKKRTYGWTAGRRTTSWTDEEKYFIEPHELRRLKKFQAVVQHCEKGFRKVTLPPRGANGGVPSWYRS
ncbi:MAG: type IV secretory system conjugative DNA transfer family protein [Opitutae bacterium]|nr:type IV secretory system conjugative DNA transfer family protein [Opitutae bacterium]